MRQNRSPLPPSASYAHDNDGGHGGHPLAALADGKEPSCSTDHSIPRFTFWNHKGTTEWVQLDLDRPAEVASVEVYWFDDRPGGGCRVPKSWQVLTEMAYTWMPVRSPSNYGTERDQYNRVTFEPVTTQSLRIEVRQQPGRSERDSRMQNQRPVRQTWLAGDRGWRWHLANLLRLSEDSTLSCLSG